MSSIHLLTRGPRVRVAFVSILSMAFACQLAAAQFSQEATAQINEQASLFAAQPVKVAANIPAPVVAGAKTQVQITLLTSDNKPAQARHDWQCEVSIAPPSGNPMVQTIVIPKGSDSAQLEFDPQQAGMTSITVRPQGSGLRPTKVDFIVVNARKPARKKTNARPLGHLLWPDLDGAAGRSAASLSSRPKFKNVRFTLNAPLPFPLAEPQDVTPPTAPVLHISLDNLGGSFFANGQDGPLISINYDSPDSSPAPADISLWFQWTNGSLVPPQPIKILRGTSKIQTRLVSDWPGSIQFQFVKSTPHYEAVGDTKVTVDFGPAGAALIGPQTVSVLDAPQVTVVFYDAQKRPVSPEKDWDVTVQSKQLKFHVAPAAFQIKPPWPTGSAVLSPVSVGTDSIEAVVSDYAMQPLSIVVTGWLALVLCIAGGTAGGIAAYNKLKGSWVARIFLGILGGAVLCWLYVFLALPSLSANVAHSNVSAFFVALIGGYGGLSTLDLASKKLGSK